MGMKSFAKVGLASWVFSALIGNAVAATYSLDTTHSEVTFKVRHLGISTVSGKFEKFGGSFDLDPKNVKATKGSATIDVGSINTSNVKRDGHLKSEDFFDVAHFPEIKFVSKEVKDVNEADTTCTLVGDFTMHGITKEIALKVKGGGIIKDGWGNERAAFTATGRINRFDFGLKWSKALETGGLVVAQDVDLDLAFEGVRKLAAPDTKPAAAKPAK